MPRLCAAVLQIAALLGCSPTAPAPAEPAPAASYTFGPSDVVEILEKVLNELQRQTTFDEQDTIPLILRGYSGECPRRIFGKPVTLYGASTPRELRKLGLSVLNVNSAVTEIEVDVWTVVSAIADGRKFKLQRTGNAWVVSERGSGWRVAR